MHGMASQRKSRGNRPRSWALAASVLGAGLGVLACRERAAQEAPAKFAPCTEVGQRCEFSPGKLGACVQRDGCHEKNCFVCQSQH
jgi:hypothetical protein